jgi:hypothetical protein
LAYYRDLVDLYEDVKLLLMKDLGIIWHLGVRILMILVSGTVEFVMEGKWE